MRRFAATWHETLPSTQDEALRRLALGEADFAVAARTQTEGRGRRGGVWVAPTGAALLVSFGLRLPAAWPSSDLTLVLALSLLDTLAPLLPPEIRPGLRVKWPNDLWIGTAKVAGILGEARTAGEQTQVALGAGVNLRQRESDFDPLLKTAATSLALSGCMSPPAPESFLSALLPFFTGRLAEWDASGLAATLHALEPHWLFKPGEALRVEWHDRMQTARYLGVSESGALRVRLTTGEDRIVELQSGEVQRVRAADADALD